MVTSASSARMYVVYMYAKHVLSPSSSDQKLYMYVDCSITGHFGHQFITLLFRLFFFFFFGYTHTSKHVEIVGKKKKKGTLWPPPYGVHDVLYILYYVGGRWDGGVKSERAQRIAGLKKHDIQYS